MKRVLLFLVFSAAILIGLEAKLAYAESDEPRYAAFISDLHMGLGKVDGQWHPYEDFRWPNALSTFLHELSLRGNDQVDLVIVGDFLELWQVPDDIACKGDGADLGCSIYEVEQIARRVIAAHSGITRNSGMKAIDALRAFSEKGDNKLHIVPGNHDAALMIPSVWTLLFEALGADEERIKLVGEEQGGVWVSSDGRLVVEHGHQIGADLNKYDEWPLVYDKKTSLMIRVGGELNVQKIFNDVERSYPIVDNLSPNSKGAWYRMQDRGLWGAIADIAKLMTFLVFETSIDHKIDYLGSEPDENEFGEIEWDLEFARNELGYRVLALALPDDDPVREMLINDGSLEQVGALRIELDNQIRSMGRDDLAHLCDLLALRGEITCKDATLGALKQFLFSSSTRVKRNHLKTRLEKYQKMTTFVYGHTHKLREGHFIDVDGNSIVEVFNTGAFQRIISNESYRKRLAQEYPGVTPAEGLSKFDLEIDINPCYTVVLAPYEDDRYKPKTWRWYGPEDGKGELIEVGDKLCE